MKKLIKNGVILLSIYLIAVVVTLFMSSRIHQLNTSSETVSTNQALSINIGR